MQELAHLRIAILAIDGVEECELTEPKKAMEGASAHVDVISRRHGEIQGYRYREPAGKIRVDRTLDEARADDYDAVLLPGGIWNSAWARGEPRVQQFLREMDGAGKPIAAIAQATWELISAGLLRGRKVTGCPTTKDDICNAGAEWLDREVVVDGNLITSRSPLDIPALNREFRAILAHLAETVGR